MVEHHAVTIAILAGWEPRIFQRHRNGKAGKRGKLVTRTGEIRERYARTWVGEMGLAWSKKLPTSELPVTREHTITRQRKETSRPTNRFANGTAMANEISHHICEEEKPSTASGDDCKRA